MWRDSDELLVLNEVTNLRRRGVRTTQLSSTASNLGNLANQFRKVPMEHLGFGVSVRMELEREHPREPRASVRPGF